LCPPNFKLDAESDGEQISWTQLLSMPIISYPDQNSCFKQIKHYFESAGYQFNPTEQVRESDTIVSLVATGSGAAILPQLSVFYLPVGVTICQLPIPLQRIVVAATLKDSDLSHAVWAFTDFLQQQ
jgi:DNA-binding transcriptional LysR family regulator